VVEGWILRGLDEGRLGVLVNVVHLGVTHHDASDHHRLEAGGGAGLQILDGGSGGGAAVVATDTLCVKVEALSQDRACDAGVVVAGTKVGLLRYISVVAAASSNRGRRGKGSGGTDVTTKVAAKGDTKVAALFIALTSMAVLGGTNTCHLVLDNRSVGKVSFPVDRGGGELED